MQRTIKCENDHKPGKNELVQFMPTNWIRLKYYPDSDRKRISACQYPAYSRSK